MSWHGYHLCGSNKIIAVWKRNSQSGQGTQSSHPARPYGEVVGDIHFYHKVPSSSLSTFIYFGPRIFHFCRSAQTIPAFEAIIAIWQASQLHQPKKQQKHWQPKQWVSGILQWQVRSWRLRQKQELILSTRLDAGILKRIVARHNFNMRRPGRCSIQTVANGIRWPNCTVQPDFDSMSMAVRQQDCSQSLQH